MVGKFPAGVLYIELLPEMVDVNVHPAKTEVRFADDSAIFEAVYYAVKNGLMKGDSRPELSLKGSVREPAKTVAPFSRVTSEEYREIYGRQTPSVEGIYKGPIHHQFSLHTNETAIFKNNDIKIEKIPKREETPSREVYYATSKVEEKFDYAKLIEDNIKESSDKNEASDTFAESVDIELRLIGEAFKTYIIVEYKGSIYFIDKHAAHERILYEKFKKERSVESQILISPESVNLSRAEHRAVLDNIELLKDAGFEIEEFGTSSVLVRAVPVELANDDIMLTVSQIAQSIMNTGKAESDRLDDFFHTVACRAAIKGGNDQSAMELEALAKLILSNNDIMYCPHGRPVAFELKRNELEKQFGRTK